MPAYKLGNDGRYLNEEWHRTRQEARSKTLSITEWGDIDRTKFDLDTVEFTGKEVSRTYVMRHPVQDDEINVTGFDVRDLPDRG